MSAAYSLFQQFQAQGELLINQMVAEGEQETLYLDFKQASTNQAPMEISDRKTLAEAISGFANAEGGLVVWGVECKRGEGQDAVDQARNCKPIRNLTNWLNDLKKFTSTVVSPVDVPVEHLAIPKADDPSSGYAVTYVPRWEGLPIMAIARKQDQYSYYVRSGDSFVKMEAFMVADRFGRRALPKLRLVVEKSFRISQGGYHSDDQHLPKLKEDHTRIQVNLSLKNEGLALAKFPGLEILSTPRHGFRSRGIAYYGYGLGLRARPDNSRGDLFVGGDSMVIYPGETHGVAGYYRDVKNEDFFDNPTVNMAYMLHCEGFQYTGLLSLNLEAIASGWDK